MNPVLAHELLTAEPAPTRWMLFLHGILGRRVNWRSFARRWVRARQQAGEPGWGAVLVDLRDHGESMGRTGERTVVAAAADLIPLTEAVVTLHGGRVAGVLGHSFGAKVAISAADQLRRAGTSVDELWVIDAPLGPRASPRDRTTDEVFSALGGLVARVFNARGEFVDALIAAGIAESVARWLATNLVQIEGSGWRFGLELEHNSALLRDFAAVDLWPTLMGESDAGAAVAMVLGGRSEAVFGDDLARAEALAAAGRIELTRVAGAGHWVHVDNPTGLLEVLARPPDLSGCPQPEEVRRWLAR